MASEFLKLCTADDARRLLAEFPAVGSEEVPLEDADGRVVAGAVFAREPLPALPRAVMDGYAVRARDVAGASEAAPAYLKVIGQVPMGRVLEVDSRRFAGGAAAISTGGVVPAGADAVVMLEYTSAPADAEIEVIRAVAEGEHVLFPGHDVAAGAPLVLPGKRLRPQDVGLLAALGHTSVRVFRRPRVAVLSSGNEIVAHDVTPAPGQVRDVNSLALAALVRRTGAIAVPSGIVPDEPEALRRALAALIEAHDCVILSGGSSIGVRDLAADVIGGLGAPGVLFHGISVRPGKPTLCARVGDKPVLGLPGVPLSAMVIFDAFVRPLLWRLGGEAVREPWPARRRAKMTRPYPSVAGREDYLRVRLLDGGGAEPVPGGSAAVSSIVRADGLVLIPSGSEGVRAGEEVDVLLYQ